MSTYKDSVTRHGDGGHARQKYHKRQDGIIRHNVRRFVPEQGAAATALTPVDAVLVVNTEAENSAGQVTLPPLAMCKNGQGFIVQNCQPTDAGNDVTVIPNGAEAVNEAAPGAPTVIGINQAWMFRRVHVTGGDSWYTTCCASPSPE